MVKHMTPLGFTAMHLAGLTLFLVGLFASPAFSASSIQLTWDANPEPDLMGYYVHMGTSQGSYNTTKNPGLTPSYIFQNLPEGSTYYFTVTAYDQSGNISEPAQEVAITLPTQGGN
ncbi:MAG: fibronectin type III domain-containing protein, partial [Nitrospirales bacterium]|nr:fibronectin type III domain-containing protein [Nitrospirales bacterium]